MKVEATKELVQGYLQNETMESTARYVSRGRAYKNLGNAALLEDWGQAFKTFVASGYGESILMDDLASELCLRELAIPYDLVAGELAQMQRSLSQMGPISPEGEQELADKVIAYAKAKKGGSN